MTSPPYWGLRDYGHDGQIGLEETPEAYVQKMVEVFREVRRVLRKDGTCWTNLGDSYAANRGYQVPDSKHVDVGNSKGMKAVDFGLKPKDLVGIPWMVAFALRADGWWLRQDIIWHKPNPMPESVTDRCTKSHEYIFLLSKSAKYFYDAGAIKEPLKDASIRRLIQNIEAQAGSDRVPGKTNGAMKAVCKQYDSSQAGGGTINNHSGYFKPDGTPLCSSLVNKKSVWTVTTKPFKGAHFATFPPKLIEPCILAGCPVGGTVLDPFFGSGTTGLVAYQYDRKFIGVELNEEYAAISKKRIQHETQQLKIFK